MTWNEIEPPKLGRPGLLGWVLVMLRIPIMAVAIFGGSVVLLLARPIEALIAGHKRPFTAWIVVLACRVAIWVLGLERRVEGKPMRSAGALVSNHVSWLDIFVLNAGAPVFFVAKAEVAGWAIIGWLARMTGTVFIKRDRKEARAQQMVFEGRLKAGHRLLFFPEGTSSDGKRILPFKSTLFAAFFNPSLMEEMSIQPVTLSYNPPEGSDVVYGWWGEMDFGSSFLAHLATFRHGSVTVTYHEPLKVAEYADRKALAAEAEAAVRKGLGVT